MDVVVNYWVWLQPAIEDDVFAVAGVYPESPSESPQPPPLSANSLSYPALNIMRADTRKMLRAFPERYPAVLPTGLWNCYVRAPGLFALTAMREDLQRVMAAYPEEFNVVGCWDYYTGSPIGGVGSPWFYKPPGLEDIMPGGEMHDIVLGAGQGKRIFI
jgi:hypothetical protein